MKYFIKKTITLIITLFIVSFLAFFAFTIIPADPTAALLGTEASPERIAALREALGLNDPFFVRYFNWLKAFITGNMGTSYSYFIPVRRLIGDKILITATMSLMAAVLIIICSVPLGIWQAKNAGFLPDSIVTVINQIVMAVPPFFLGIIMCYVFGLILRLFTPGYFVSYTVSPAAFFNYLIFPAIAIALPRIAMTSKMLRGSIINELDEDYVRTARSRGNGTTAILYGHVLRNALVPVITFIGMTIADIVASSIIIEQVFSIPGMGQLLLISISTRDYPVVLAIVVIIAFIVVFINYLVDILYQFIDPRVTL
ncbi:MAG: ABC transporter permease [Oscillospiraceae bacterium]|nr:ABC transporter permease [Oscillospiraceae bacterium]